MKLNLCIDRKDRNTPTEELRKYLIDIGCPLRSVEDVFDELKITTNDLNKLEGKIIRRCYVDKYGVLRKLETEEIQVLDIPEIELFEGTNYIYIAEYTNLNMKIEYLTNAEMNKYFATKTEMNSTIQQTYDSIMLKVSEKADSTEVASMIKMLADEIALRVVKGDVVNELNISDEIISIIGNRLRIETDNFKVTENGSIEAKSGKIAGYLINGNTFKGSDVGMCGLPGEEYAFWAGNDTGHEAPFRVSHLGELKCSNAEITGGSIKGVDIYLTGTHDAQKMKIAYSGDPNNYYFTNMSYGFVCRYGGSYVGLIPMGEYHAFELSHGDKFTYIDCKEINTPKITVGNIDCGQGSCSSDGYTKVNFNKTFPSIPRVVATPNTNTNGVLAIKIRNVSTTGFEATLGGTNFGYETFEWIAISN